MKSFILPRLPQQMRDRKGARIYRNLLSKFNDPHQEPHSFVQWMMEAFESLKKQPDRSVHGRYFEYVIGETLARQGIRYLYFQTKVRHVPLATFDWFLYHPTRPVSIACKTKAREKWKQAAFEAMALKHVYSGATNYLVTVEALSGVDEKKEQALHTIDHFIVATEPEYSDAVKEIASTEFAKATDVSPIIEGRLLACEDEQ